MAVPSEKAEIPDIYVGKGAEKFANSRENSMRVGGRCSDITAILPVHIGTQVAQLTGMLSYGSVVEKREVAVFDGVLDRRKVDRDRHIIAAHTHRRIGPTLV